MSNKIDDYHVARYIDEATGEYVQEISINHYYPEFRNWNDDSHNHLDNSKSNKVYEKSLVK